jgi:hypothetical protein
MLKKMVVGFGRNKLFSKLSPSIHRKFLGGYGPAGCIVICEELHYYK